MKLSRRGFLSSTGIVAASMLSSIGLDMTPEQFRWSD